MNLKGLVVIEGVDGSGKGTLAKNISTALTEADIDHEVIAYPDYDSVPGTEISRYLNGNTSLENDYTGALHASLLYAYDRKLKDNYIREQAEKKLIICDRYVMSNIAFQTAKVEGEERDKLQQEIYDLEYKHFGLRHPDLTIVLACDAKTSMANTALKAKRSYTDMSHDIHEGDIELLENANKLYITSEVPSGDKAIIPIVDDNDDLIDPQTITAIACTHIMESLNEDKDVVDEEDETAPHDFTF